MQDVRKIIVGQMKKLKLTPYAVAKRAQEAGGKLSEQTVRNFVDGTHDMTSDKLAAVLAAVKLKLVTEADLERLKDYEFRYKSVSH